MFLPKKETKI